MARQSPIAAARIGQADIRPRELVSVCTSPVGTVRRQSGAALVPPIAAMQVADNKRLPC
jgi:hypothetical protein